MKEIPINCAHDGTAIVTDLVHHPKNPNTHSESQIGFIKKVLAHQGWRAPLVVSNLSGKVVCGNGRLMAAREMGLEAVPVDLQDFKNEEDEIAHMLADNRLAGQSEMDFEVAAALLGDLEGTGFDLDLTGFLDFEREPLLNADWQPEDLGELDLPGDQPAKPIGVTNSQREVFERALAKMKAEADDSPTSEGRAVELLAADFLAG